MCRHCRSNVAATPITGIPSLISVIYSYSRSMLIPLILSGGSGTRLWPVSRQAHPKPFIKLADGRSLVQKTVDRLGGMTGIPEIITVTNRDHFFVTRDEYAAGGSTHRHLMILEPSARNTAPAVAIGALAALARHGKDATLLVLPADHLVEDHAAFAATVSDALVLAERDLLVTFGIKPTYAETGFGYIERGERLAGTAGFRVLRFTEKPAGGGATDMVQAGLFYWNSGMFFFRASAFIAELAQHAPEMLEQ